MSNKFQSRTSEILGRISNELEKRHITHTWVYLWGHIRIGNLAEAVISVNTLKPSQTIYVLIYGGLLPVRHLQELLIKKNSYY